MLLFFECLTVNKNVPHERIRAVAGKLNERYGIVYISKSGDFAQRGIKFEIKTIESFIN